MLFLLPLALTSTTSGAKITTRNPSYVHDEKSMEQFCSSKGKYLTLTAHELRNIIMESHVTLPSDVTITLVLMDDLYADTSALRRR